MIELTPQPDQIKAAGLTVEDLLDAETTLAALSVLMHDHYQRNGHSFTREHMLRHTTRCMAAVSTRTQLVDLAQTLHGQA